MAKAKNFPFTRAQIQELILLGIALAVIAYSISRNPDAQLLAVWAFESSKEWLGIA